MDYCIKNQIKYFRGDLENVAERFLHAGLKFDYDYAIRVNGDNLFLDHKLISEMISILDLNHYDLVSNVKDRTFPKGISVEIVNMKFYKKLFDKFNQSKYQEHVTITCTSTLIVGILSFYQSYITTSCWGSVSY